MQINIFVEFALVV